MGMNDKNGCTLCGTAGEERFEYFTGATRPHRQLCQYDYRASNGRLFSCVRPTLAACRTARDAWLKQNGLEG